MCWDRIDVIREALEVIDNSGVCVIKAYRDSNGRLQFTRLPVTAAVEHAVDSDESFVPHNQD